MTIRMNNDPEWVAQLNARDRFACVSAGAASESEPVGGATPYPPMVFGRLVHYCRRSCGWTLEYLAERAKVELSELVRLEQDPLAAPQPTTVRRLAVALSLPADSLLALAGVGSTASAELAQAAVRFAARSAPAAPLSAMEHAALTEFVAAFGHPPADGP